MTAERLPLSVCMIAGAEAARIGRALDSVAGWTAEIIVVLNEDVADGTDRIAAEFGAKIFREPWRGHIAQKNSAAAKATQEWLLGLDADEEVTPALRDEISARLRQSPGQIRAVAFSLPRCSLYCGRWLRRYKRETFYPERPSILP